MLDDRKLFSSISVAGTLKSASTMLVSSGSEDEFPSLSPRLLSVASNVWVSSAQRCLNPSSVSTFGGFAFDCLFGFPTGNILRFRAHLLQGDSLRHRAKTSVLKYLNSIYRMCECTHAYVPWLTNGGYRKLWQVSFFSHVGPPDQTWLTGLVAGTLAHWTISQPSVTFQVTSHLRL